MAATTSSSCTGFLGLGSNRDESRVRTSSNHGSPGCGKLDGMAVWFVNGVTTAFFASLEGFSCIRVSTEEDGEEGHDLPLIVNDGNLHHSGGTTSRRRTGTGKKSGAVLVEEE